MADPHGTVAYRPAPGEIPESPGVYRFRDQRGRVIYVGKAKSLRQRLNQYFADFASLHPRTQMMLQTAAGVEWTVVGTEVEALQLEYSWIKEFDPRFNIKYRDDKSYPYLAVTMGEEYPRVMVMRGAKRKGTRYFGPYSHAWAIRDTVDTLLRVFPVRTCSAGVFKRSGQIGRPCLLGYIGKCSAPCVKRVSAEEHRRLAEDFCDFMAGQTSRFASRLEAEMKQAAREEEFERAARLRDDLRALERAIEKQAVVLGDGTDCDVIALAEDQLEAAVQVFYVRGGRVRGQRGWVLDKIEEVTPAGLVEQFLGQVYADSPAGTEAINAGIPREVLVPELPPDPDTMSQWLAERRGGPVSLRVPRRGDKKALLETVARNAGESLALHKTRRASDLTTRSKALNEIQEALGLDDAPLRIECYDVSNLQGTHVVASMVVFEDGLARKSEYRRFAIKGTDGTDDISSIHEVITRRFRRYLAEREKTGELDTLGDPEAGEDSDDGAERADVTAQKKFSYPPNLVVVDGGPLQAEAAARALAELGIDDVAVCGLAKRLEEVWIPGEEYPVILPRSSEGLYLLQRVRDEAHRFAIAYHRAKRGKAATTSALDDVPGLGPARRKALLKQFGSVRKLGAASIEEIAAVPGIGTRLAATISAALAGGRPRTPPGPGPPWGNTMRTADDPADIVIITGMSGAGRSTAAKSLEDLGWFVVDNLPPGLLPTMVDLAARSNGAVSRMAAVVDVRSRAFSTDLKSAISDLGARGATARVVYLEAAEDTLVRRFDSERRPHPLQGTGRVTDGIAAERELLRGARGDADLVLDTTRLNVHELRARMRDFFGGGAAAGLRLSVVSFGYKYGLPVDADQVADCRFLPNPHWIPELAPMTGQDAPVREYVLSQPGAAQFLEHYAELLRVMLAGYEREGKRFVTLAVGCTGGKHRSVAIAAELAARVADAGTDVQVVHRDLGRE